MALTRARTQQMLSKWVDRKVYALALIASCAAGVGISYVVSPPATVGRSSDAQGDVVVASGADRFPNSSAADWITYADHVVVGSVVDERRVPPTGVELERGEGLVLRELTVSVEKVLWSAPGQKPAAPSTFGWPAMGWTFNADPTYRETVMTGEHAPRLEVGNSYIFALDRPSGYCEATPEDAPTWRGLGAASVLPLSEGVIGAGEFEGRHVSPEEARTEWEHIGAVLPASVAGKGIVALTAALSRASSDPAAREAARADKCTRMK